MGNFDENLLKFFVENLEKDLRQNAPSVAQLRGWLFQMGVRSLSQLACLPDDRHELDVAQKEENVVENYLMKRVRTRQLHYFCYAHF